MGMLAGFVQGATGEYTKQRGEERTNQFQAIRDKRVSELRKGEQKHAAGLVSTENVRKEDVLAGAGQTKAEALLLSQQEDRKSRLNVAEVGNEGQVVAAGAALIKDGKVIHSQANKPLAGDADGSKYKYDERSVVRSNGQPTTYKQLYNEWHKMKYTKDEFGIEVGNQKIPEWEPWVNKQVQPKYRINPPPPRANTADEAWENIQKNKDRIDGYSDESAIEAIRGKYNLPDWSPHAENAVTAPAPAPAADTSGLLAKGEGTPSVDSLQQRKDIRQKIKDLERELDNVGFTLDQEGTERQIRELDTKLTALQKKGGKSVKAEQRSLLAEIDRLRRKLGRG